MSGYAQEAYAVVNDGALTFYYDNNKPLNYFSWEELTRQVNYANSYSVDKIVFDQSFKNFKPTTCAYLCSHFHYITEIVGMKENLNSDDVTDMTSMFSGCCLLKTIDLSGFNTSKVTSMDFLFYNCLLNIFFEKMIIDFHCLMRESRSILSRIYGLYKIDLIDKGSIYVIVQRNMDDLPFDTKLLTFDFKGSTVDRQIISKGDLGLIREKLWAKYKNKVLKDIDLDLIGLKFILEYENWKNIISIIDADSSFLQNLGVTDYSLVVFVHKYRKDIWK